jgi:hypothetical protein
MKLIKVWRERERERERETDRQTDRQTETETETANLTSHKNSVLLGYDTVSVGKWITVFGSNVASS